MTSREITSLAIKVFAIYVLVQVMLAVPALIQALGMFGGVPGIDGNSQWYWIFGVLAILCLFSICVGLWKLSNRVLEEVSLTSKETHIVKIDEAAVLAVLGLYLIFIGLQHTAFWSIGAYIRTGQNMSSTHTAYVVAYLLQIAFGLSLVMRSNGWVVLLRKLRGAGLENKISESTDSR